MSDFAIAFIGKCTMLPKRVWANIRVFADDYQRSVENFLGERGMKSVSRELRADVAAYLEGRKPIPAVGEPVFSGLKDFVRVELVNEK